ncbi:exopolysaccharide biosynthesis protein [Pseudoxanthomonas mexicana]|uniref:exopolysaccharide biosynthesis protein n=1 Tax=Pseudoxanthomonas mexicana TaxID=128785 RepID=UPI0011D34267|nr:exopolysaccharide biosynthesis protein [Pseudoxanthomonas mexicana]TXH81097.1 MAG: exopolysaccharide biosynthesis protein [Pseudoxanthomonas sp.]WBX93748.1 exopolysaccharide biosynthesis protein [Pseudoxanthomonas mexicana]
MTDAPHTEAPDPAASLGQQLADIIERLPPDALSLGELLDVFSDEGLLLLTILLTLVFLIPVSIPGVSTVFGAAILLVGVSRLINRPLWLPQRVKHKALPAARLRPGLTAGLVWVRRMEKISRPHRLRLFVDGPGQGVINNLAFILAALLLMAPFGFVPFSNTLPALALLLYAIGFIQRDGGAILLGHLANIGTIVYFSVLIGGGGVAVRELFQRLTG